MSLTINMNLAPDLASVHGYAGDAIKNFHRIENINLDYSVESLKLIDAVLLEWKDQGAPLSAINKTLFAIGSYAGEVLLKHRTGKWVEPTNPTLENLEEAFLYVKLDNDLQWSPIYTGIMMMLIPFGEIKPITLYESIQSVL